VLPLESVPNVSEGRDAKAIASIGQAFATGARLLDVHSDPDHHRSVYTLVGTDNELVDGLLAGIRCACEHIDLRNHDGIHPRVGAADVVPLVPLRDDDMERAKAAALDLGRRVGEELGLPVFLYGEIGEGRRPAFFRRGGPEELQRRVSDGELAPAFGPSRLDPAAGAVLVGARPLLVAFNVDLATDDLELARSVAAAVRSSSGGLVGVQAIGLRLPRSGRVQVSLNVIDVGRARLADVVARVRSEALARGAGIAGGELVGLLPESARAAAEELGLAALTDDHILERRLAL
jgi:glutamate formiminotransferase